MSEPRKQHEKITREAQQAEWSLDNASRSALQAGDRDGAQRWAELREAVRREREAHERRGR